MVSLFFCYSIIESKTPVALNINTALSTSFEVPCSFLVKEMGSYYFPFPPLISLLIKYFERAGLRLSYRSTCLQICMAFVELNFVWLM